jgi:PAS domain S-box-containing protein
MTMTARILIVDDDPAMLMALSGMVELRLKDIAMDTCESALGALEFIGHTDYDAIVSDVKMPGMDGFQLMERVLTVRPTTPTLLVTGHGDHDMGVKALNAGAYAFIPKPIDRDFFIAWLKRAIQLRQLSRTVERHTEELEQTVKQRTAELERNNIQLQRVSELHRESEALYRSLAEAMPQIVYVTRRDGTAEYVNDQWVDYTGVPREEALKHEWTEAVHPDDVPLALERWTGAVEEGGLFETEYRLKRADGQYRWHLSRALPMRDEYGHIIKWIGTSTDIHDRKRSEEALRESEDRYKRLVKYSPDAILINRDNRIVFVNEAGLALFGASHRGQLLGKSPFDLFHPNCHPLVAQRIKRLGEDGESLAMTEERIVKLDGAIVDVEVMASAFLDQGMRAIHVILHDITERTRAEQILRVMAAKTDRQARVFDTTLSAITDFVYIFDRDARFLFVNQALLDLWGLELKDAVGKNFFELGYPEVLAAKLDAQIHRVFETGERITDETAYTSPAGVSGFYEYIFSPVHADDGSVEVVAGSTRDITKHKQTEEAVRQRTEQFETLLNEAPLGVYMVDGDFRIRHVNPIARSAFGSIPDLLGRDFDEVIHVLWPQAYADEIVAIFHHTLETGEPYIVAERVEERRDRGVREFYEWQIHRIPLPEGGYGVVCYFRDISAHVQAREAIAESEERFRTLADNMSQFAWMADATGWISWYNRRWFEYTGATLAEMQGWGWEKVHHPDHVDRVVQKWRRAHETGEPWEDTFPLRGQDGRYRWFLSRALPIRDADGQVIRWFGTNTDVTDQLAAEASLRDKQEQLVQAAKLASIGELASGMAHELNNPLNNIGLFVGNVLHQLEEGQIDPPRMRYNLQTTLQQVNKAAAIITHLRTFARSAATHPEPVVLHRVIQSAVSLVEAQLCLQNVQLTLDPGLGNFVVLGNAIQLEQVFINLLTNARDAIAATADKRITISNYIHGAHIDVAVSDTGSGISSEHHARVFDPFFTTKEIGKGTGLGLSISYGIIKDHGGTITVESKAGKGTTFVVRLPIAESSAES